ncbi:MAG: hypothetical protein EOP84_22375 [Verrucomicrobiaceae bacterium]|nr:MAG: hypothetical protein EOP84_22375 [Verrucomicrobiaceae bacterium]
MTKAQKLQALHHVPKLTEAQAESFLLKNGRDAANLVTAFRTSGVHRYLREAMAKWPEDPQVAFEALALADLSSTERRQRVNAFKRAMPDNSVGNYLSAIQHFRDGSREAAISELETAFGKSKFDDMTLARMQGNEEAYRGSGFSEAQSHVVAMFQLPLPLLNEMRFLSSQMDELSQSYLQEGDTASAEATVRIALNLGEQYRASGNALLVHQQLGWDIGQNALRTLDPGSQFGDSGRSVQDLLDSMNMQRREVSSLLKESVPLQDLMEPEDWVVYTDRMKMLGEPNAMRWLLAKYKGR